MEKRDGRETRHGCESSTTFKEGKTGKDKDQMKTKEMVCLEQKALYAGRGDAASPRFDFYSFSRCPVQGRVKWWCGGGVAADGRHARRE